MPAPDRTTPSALFRALQEVTDSVRSGVRDDVLLVEVLDAVALELAMGAQPARAFADVLSTYGLTTSGHETPGLDLLGPPPRRPRPKVRRGRAGR